jgi:hypothetical protein
MTLVRDNDDERRARVEALICQLLRSHDRALEPLEPSLRTLAPAEHTLEREPPPRAAHVRIL